ncbi:ATP-grasp domain-containing protein [Serratia fonticola]|uniref:ATP-grasp domain-containing protein n=1 Tax=Serratia fonticola TaxID=47917 RepID=UPI003BB6438C
MHSTSYYEMPNITVLIQSFLAGQEYIIDSVSLNGKHYLTSILAVKRDNGPSPFLDYMETVDYTLFEYRELREYAKEVLNALGVRNGPSHLEIILTENGPTLVELNCRLHGSLDLRLTTYACGRNHVQDVVASLLSPDYFAASYSQPPTFYGQAMHVLLRSPQAGRRLRKNYWEKLETLSSFVSYKSNLVTGEITPITKNLKTSVGTLSLFNLDSKQLADDLSIVRNEENTGFMYESD